MPPRFHICCLARLLGLPTCSSHQLTKPYNQVSVALTPMLKAAFGRGIHFLLRGVRDPRDDVIVASQPQQSPLQGSVSDELADIHEQTDRVSLHRQQEDKADKLHETNDAGLASARHIWALGIVIVIRGQYFSWNAGLEAGLGSFSVAVFMTGSMYLCLVLCLAEMNSAMPFAGGAYGFARVTMGTYIGYLVGCCESLEYIMYVAISVIRLGLMITSLTNLPESMEPLYWIIFYCIALAIHIYSGRALWPMCLYTAVVITLILVVYCLGTTPWMNFQQHAALTSDNRNHQWFAGGGYVFMKCLPQAAWFFVGVEALPLASAGTSKPRTNVPAGMIACICTLLLTSLGVLFCSVSLPPGIEELTSALFPLNYGFSFLLQASSRFMSLLTLPAVCATAFGFMFAYGRQMYAMARSGLFPEVMSRTTEHKNTPYVALSVGSFVGLIVCACGWRWVKFEAIIFPICMIGAYCAYMSQFVSFIVLREYYPNLKREFRSPLGVCGAMYGFLIALFSFFGALGFQDYQYEAAVATVLYVSLASVYYWFSARYTQQFSPEEQSVLFVAYIIKYNIKMHKSRSQPNSRTLRRSVVTPGKSTSMSEKTFSDQMDQSFHRGPKPNVETSIHNVNVTSEREVLPDIESS